MTNEGHITMLYVHPQYLRRGIGKKLLERVRIYARMQLKLMQVSVNAMPAYTADYFSRVGFKSAYQGGFCNGQGDMYVPMTAKSIYQVEYTPRHIADKTFIAISVGFTCLVFVSGVIYAVCAGLIMIHFLQFKQIYYATTLYKKKETPSFFLRRRKVSCS